MRDLLFHFCLAVGFFALGISARMIVQDYDLGRFWVRYVLRREQLAAETAEDDRWADTLHSMIGAVPSSEPVPAITVGYAPPLISPSGPPAAVYAFQPPMGHAELDVVEGELVEPTSWDMPPIPALTALPAPRTPPLLRGAALQERYRQLMSAVA